MGIDELSVHPMAIASCKAIIRRCDQELLSALRNRGLEDMAAVEQLINHDLKKYYQN
jgi:phosphoenolpyruvate-protein kinase (PTS system EI component)